MKLIGSHWVVSVNLFTIVNKYGDMLLVWGDRLRSELDKQNESSCKSM